MTEKTAWSKGGKPATKSDFKASEVVYVVPRLLPGGGIMATAVSDTTQSAAHLKERAKYTVSGTLTAVDLPNRKIALKSVSSDLRDITLAEDCEARVSGRDVPLTYLKPGQQITVHLRKNEEDEREARLITIVSKRTTKKYPIRTPIKKHLARRQLSRGSESPKSSTIVAPAFGLVLTDGILFQIPCGSANARVQHDGQNAAERQPDRFCRQANAGE